MVSTPSLTRRRVLRATGIAVGTSLAGCTGGESEQTTEQAHADEDQHGTESDHQEGSGHGHGSIGDPVEHATVKMTTEDGEYHFEPHIVRVKKGGTVSFVNESGSHSSTAYHPDNDGPLRMPDSATAWDSGSLSDAGEEFEHTFQTEGVYDFFCTPHESVGMVGSVIVGEPDAHGQPALEPPQESLPEKTREKITSLNERCNEALGHAHDE